MCYVLFVPRGQTICLSPRGQTFLTNRGGQTFLHHWGENILHKVVDEHFVGIGGGDNDVDGEEEDVSEANIFVSEASKLSAGARILRGPKGLEILVL